MQNTKVSSERQYAITSMSAMVLLHNWKSTWGKFHARTYIVHVHVSVIALGVASCDQHVQHLHLGRNCEEQEGGKSSWKNSVILADVESLFFYHNTKDYHCCSALRHYLCSLPLFSLVKQPPSTLSCGKTYVNCQCVYTVVCIYQTEHTWDS